MQTCVRSGCGWKGVSKMVWARKMLCACGACAKYVPPLLLLCMLLLLLLPLLLLFMLLLFPAATATACSAPAGSPASPRSPTFSLIHTPPPPRFTHQAHPRWQFKTCPWACTKESDSVSW